MFPFQRGQVPDELVNRTLENAAESDRAALIDEGMSGMASVDHVSSEIMMRACREWHP